MSSARAAGLAVAVAAVAGCGDGGGGADDAAAPGVDARARPPAASDPSRDVVSTAIYLDLASLTGTAVIMLAPSDSRAATLAVGDLDIASVRDAVGPLDTARSGERLDIGIDDDGDPVIVTVEYAFAQHDSFDGYLAGGLTFLWPTFCDNLFPCKQDPDDGARFALSLRGVPDGAIAVYPEAIAADGPSYMPAFAIGAYEYRSLGTTAAGTDVGVYYFPADEADALAGTQDLPAAFGWLESRLGDYPFGRRVASVQANWPGGAYGGMEHHPYWHVARPAMGVPEVHAHEAAHGWFGNGVRLRCWEDFALSEGTASYLAARALEDVAGLDLWPGYQTRLDAVVASGDTVAWPAGCNQINLLFHPLWSDVPYMKGAFFLRAVETQIGRATLDAALAAFFQAHVGQAAGMQDLIDALETGGGQDLDALVAAWLTGLGVP
jgi:hypothetical protein